MTRSCTDTGIPPPDINKDVPQRSTPHLSSKDKDGSDSAEKGPSAAEDVILERSPQRKGLLREKLLRLPRPADPLDPPIGQQEKLTVSQLPAPVVTIQSATESEGEDEGLVEGEEVMKPDAKGEAMGDAMGDAMGEAMREAMGEAMGEVLGDAKDEAMGDAMDEAMGHLETEVPEQVELLSSPETTGGSPTPVIDSSRSKFLCCLYQS